MPHIRSRPTTEIAIKNLIVPDSFEHDDQFHRLVIRDIQGQLKIGLTRLSQDKIISGFYKREGKSAVHVSNLQLKYLRSLTQEIRGGARPIVEVYWNTLVPGGGGYACPDGEVVLAAYRELGIMLVPAKILKPKKISGSEGCLWLEAVDRRATLSQVVAPKVESYAGYSLENASIPDAMNYLIEECEQGQRAIERFHENTGAGLNYHQVLHAILRRHARYLDSINSLISESRLEHAYILTRSAYEAFLNWYIDWLSPEFFGPRLQLLSTIRFEPNQDDEGEGLAALANFVSFLESTIEKARASTLGEHFYRAIYAPLSRVVHQSYAYIEREASDFSDQPDDVDSINQLILCLNVLTFAIVNRILDDVGEGRNLTPP